MNRDQVKGRVERAKDKAKEAAADLSGNTQLEAEGKADQLKGKARAEAGDTKRKIKRSIDRA